MSTVIKVENLTKKYLINHQKTTRYTALRDVMAESAKKWGKRLAHPFAARNWQGSGVEEFLAINNLSFEIKQGERVGIIGRNGAGKSTLLKVLSRITEPTSGRVFLKGRVASLLEVGTGFHPELTGRENIFLNGAILGMSKAEIKKKFDEIVDFAEVEKFLDTPVKRYSSGMYVRLAFAVASHLDSEILIVDEVLAVGDVQFQKKCLGKMGEVTSDGRTVLLVSHNMPTIMSLSTDCILLEEGKLVKQALPSEVISKYQNSFYDNTFSRTDLKSVERFGSGEAKFLSIKLEAINRNGDDLEFPVTGCDLRLNIEIESIVEIKNTTVALTIYDEIGNRLIDVNTLIKGTSLTMKKGQRAVVTFILKNVCLKPDVYTAGLWLGILNNIDIDVVRYATTFRMEPNREDVLYTTPFPGVYACEFEHLIELI